MATFQEFFLIKEKYSSNKLDDQFEHVFCVFYIMNGAGGLNELQKKEFFKLLSSKETDLETILKSLYKIPGYQGKNKLFLSFSTKLINTVKNNEPIYDNNVCQLLWLPIQTNFPNHDLAIENRLYIYDILKNKFRSLLNDPSIKKILKELRYDFIKQAKEEKFLWQNTLISDEKILDSALWALYKVLKKNQMANLNTN